MTKKEDGCKCVTCVLERLLKEDVMNAPKALLTLALYMTPTRYAAAMDGASDLSSELLLRLRNLRDPMRKLAKEHGVKYPPEYDEDDEPETVAAPSADELTDLFKKKKGGQ